MQYKEGLAPASYGLPNNPPYPCNQYLFHATQQNDMASGLPRQLPTLPTGVPLGTPVASAVPTAPATGVPAVPGTQGQAMQIPVTVENTLFTAGFLRTQIGRRVRVEFLLGTNLLTDRTGTLVAVGASYIILRPPESDDLIMCDIYSIRFVTIIL
ncbi:MAG: hypothetical protein ACOYJ1_13740 [Peptococcales bacterium]|jgi:hypothetical protein